MKRTSVGAIFLTVVVDLIGFGIVLPVLPLYADQLQASGTQIGLLFSSFSAMQFLFAPFWGRISDRVGRRPILLLGLSGSVVFYTVFGLADSIPMLFASRIGAGICGATISVSNAYIADITPRDQRVRGMALIGMAFGIGFTVGAPLGIFAMHEGQVLYEKGFVPQSFVRGLPGFVAAFISLVSLIWTLVSVGEPERHEATDRKLFDLGALRRARSAGYLEFLLALHLLSVFSFSNFESTLSLMLTDRFGYSKQQMGYVYVFLSTVLVLAQGLLVRKVLARMRETSMIRLGFVLMAAGLAGLAFGSGLVCLLGSVAVAVTGFGCVTPSISALVSKQADAANQGAMLGLAASASALGRIFGPLIGNVVYAGAGPDDGVVTALLAAPFGSLDPNRRPYALATAIVALLAVTAILFLKDREEPPAAA